MKKIKVSFIGAGNMSKEHIKVFNANKNFLVKGVFSRTKAKLIELKKLYPKLEVYKSIREMYFKTKSDLVVVSISEEQFIKIIKEIVKFSWVCLAEKPLGLNFLETNFIYQVVKKKNAKVFVSLNRRFYKSTIEAKKILNKSNKKRSLTIVDSQIRKQFKTNALKLGIKKSKKAIKYLMYANSVHLVDYISQFCRGDLINVKRNINWKIKRPRDFIAKLDFSSGDKVKYVAYWKTPKKWEINIKFGKFNFKIKPLERLIASKSLNLTKKINYQNDIKFKPGLYQQSKELFNFFSRKKNNLISLEEYLKTINFIKKIYSV